ncbi:hypothetical protein [Neptunomonas concharum]|uniref:Uncharacterized protein n=1 Tax=Neptunomonas concharum TaxID=1031538 RepID=A0A5P1R9E5_9GAMM|nr:hypothetical protein [Neptunomonas concharum]QEQ96254.1 hypothetical protein F0U83_05770 [Neptunomonas concharum]
MSYIDAIQARHVQTNLRNELRIFGRYCSAINQGIELNSSDARDQLAHQIINLFIRAERQNIDLASAIVERLSHTARTEVPMCDAVLTQMRPDQDKASSIRKGTSRD